MTTAQATPKKGTQGAKLIKILASIAVGTVIANIPPPAGLEKAAMIYIGAFLGMVILMATAAVPEFVSILATCGVLVVCKVASIAEVFAPFAQATVWQIITILTFAVAAQKGTILLRTSLNILKPFPPTYAGQIIAMTLSITLLNFMIPSSFVKIAILAPVAISICDACGYEKNSKPAAGFFSILFVIALHASFGLTTGNTAWALMSGFMKTESFKPAYNFTSWLSATWMWMLVLTVGTLLFVLTYYKPKGGGLADKDFVKNKLAALPPLDTADKKIAVILIATILVWMTESLHGLNSIGVTLLAIFAFVATGILEPADFKSKVDWTTILMIGGILCVAEFTNTLGISALLADLLAPMAEKLMSSTVLFIVSVSVIQALLRLVFVSNMPPMIILISLFQPFCQARGIHPFIIVFVSYIIGQCFTTNYNYIMLPPVYPMTQNRLTDFKGVQPMAFMYVVLCILGFLASIPVWKAIGYLP